MLSTANQKQVGGGHYQSTFQHWDFVDLLNVRYLPAQVSKYLSRWQKKNGLQDLEKAMHFLDKFIEQERDRHLHSQMLMDNYARSNGLSPEEKGAIRALMMYGLGDSGQLAIARAAIARLIRAEQSRLLEAQRPLVDGTMGTVEEPENPMRGDDP